MKKHLLTLVLIVSVVGFASCHSSSDSKKEVPDIHTSQNSLDWDGIYRGLLPCADCPGIQKTIFLNKDGTYRLRVKYLGKPDSAKEYSGTIKWNDQGNTIILNENTQPVSFRVGENMLTQLDKSGNIITGDLGPQFILSKDHFAVLEKYWKLTELMGKPVVIDSASKNIPHIIFNDDDSRFFGNGGCNNFSGTYQISGMNRIRLSQIAVTQMMCIHHMEIESQFLEVMKMADNFNLVDDMLVLNRARMAPLARFKAVEAQK